MLPIRAFHADFRFDYAAMPRFAALLPMPAMPYALLMLQARAHAACYYCRAGADVVIMRHDNTLRRLRHATRVYATICRASVVAFRRLFIRYASPCRYFSLHYRFYAFAADYYVSARLMISLFRRLIFACYAYAAAGYYTRVRYAAAICYATPPCLAALILPLMSFFRATRAPPVFRYYASQDALLLRHADFRC